MSHRTVVLSSVEECLGSDDDSIEERAAQQVDRAARLSRFPYAVMLQVAFPELDFANHWCWQNFGPCDGECAQSYSRYRACDRSEPHLHVGKWTSHWSVKTDCDFGFNEWYFAESVDRDRFLASVDKINWGEDFAK